MLRFVKHKGKESVDQKDYKEFSSKLTQDTNDWRLSSGVSVGKISLEFRQRDEDVDKTNVRIRLRKSKNSDITG